ncbi:MAG: geranylgeranylglyceryl/heptaprenylglyceryl phosphate synthase [Thermoplasmata archaeon]|nr:geranylgeranylglyceryl/heptaprenylglyceryl phosphate synthase [Thermoplasmata archaeon]
MRVWEYIEKKIANSEKMHMTLLDPDKQSPAEAGEIAGKCEELGSDAIMIGGSTGVTRENMDATARAIKAELEKIPLIIFPTKPDALTPHADAIYFMSMLNSQDLNFVIGYQVLGAMVVKKLGIEPIPMGYIIIEPGMKVAEVGSAKVIPRHDIRSAVAHALAAEYLGMNLVYLEAGSGAHQHVPPEMVSEVRKNIGIGLIAGGGIRTPESASQLARAGADIIVTGTVVEEASDIENTLGKIIAAVKHR